MANRSNVGNASVTGVYSGAQEITALVPLSIALLGSTSCFGKLPLGLKAVLVSDVVQSNTHLGYLPLYIVR